MKRGTLVWIFVAGVAGALAYLYQTGNLPDVTDFSSQFQDLIASFRQGANTIVGSVEDVTGINDALTKATQLIAGFEGFSAHAYPDADGFSIGYGHFITADDPYDANSTISENDAYNLLQSDVAVKQDCVNQAVDVPLTVNQQAALISLCYNIGCSAFSGSTLVRDLNANDFESASQQFAVWNKSGGQVLQVLVDRRAQEAEVFNS